MKQTFLRIGTHAVALFALLVLSVISFHCIESPLEPVAPTFDTQLSIPIIDKTEYFDSFAKKDTLLIFDPTDSTYYRNSTITTEPIQIDSMNYQLTSSDTVVALGVFDVDAFSLLPRNVSASDFGIPTGSLPGGLPAGTFSANPIQFVDTSTFDYVAVNSGTLTLTITNNLPIPISFPNPIVLRNNWSAPIDINEIASFTIPGTLNQGDSVSLPSPLNNVFVRGLLTTGSIVLQTTGTSNPVTISVSDGVALSFRSSQLQSDSAFAVIPTQILSPIENGTFTVDDSTVIKEALFKSGNFSVSITNNANISAQFHIIIADLISTLTGTSFTRDITIQSGGNHIFPIDMITHRITTPGIGLGTLLHYSVNVEVLGSQGEKRLVSKNDFMQAELQPDQPLVAQYVNGRFKPTPLSINSGFKSEFDLGKDINKVKAQLFFKNMKLKLQLSMPVDGIPFSYGNLQLIAMNSKHNQTRSITISDGIIDPLLPNPSIDISQSSNITDFTNFTNFFGEFFPDLPDSFFVRSLLTVSPQSVFESGKFYGIYDTSKVYPSFEMSIPTDLAITNGSLADVSKNPIKDDVDESLIRSIRVGTMNFEFTNRIPIAMSFQLRFLKWNSARANSDTLFRIFPDSLIKAPIVDINGVAINSKTSNVAVVLTGPEVEMMAQADSVHIKLDFNTGNGQSSVKFKKDDYIRIRSSFNARCTINKP